MNGFCRLGLGYCLPESLWFETNPTKCRSGLFSAWAELSLGFLRYGQSFNLEGGFVYEEVFLGSGLVFFPNDWFLSEWRVSRSGGRNVCGLKTHELAFRVFFTDWGVVLCFVVLCWAELSWFRNVDQNFILVDRFEGKCFWVMVWVFPKRRIPLWMKGFDCLGLGYCHLESYWFETPRICCPEFFFIRFSELRIGSNLRISEICPTVLIGFLSVW